MTILCKCNTCEAIFDRTVKVIGKMLTDQECTICVEATAYAFAALAQEVMTAATNELLKKEGRFSGVPLIDAVILGETLARVQDDTAAKMAGVWIKDKERLVADLNVYVSAAAKARKEEQNLPKDT